MLATEWEKIDHFIDILVPKYAEQAYVLRTEIETLRASLRSLREREAKPRSNQEDCDLCCGGDAVDPRVAVTIGAQTVIVHPQCLAFVASSVEREAREGK